MSKCVDEYKSPSGQTCTLEKDPNNGRWYVGMWNDDGSCHWHLSFPTEADARVEYERWRT